MLKKDQKFERAQQTSERSIALDEQQSDICRKEREELIRMDREERRLNNEELVKMIQLMPNMTASSQSKN